ncbi:unnamed protein product, partial [marine sediment metagenome]
SVPDDLVDKYQIALQPNLIHVICESLKVKQGDMLIEGDYGTPYLNWMMDDTLGEMKESYKRDIGNIPNLTEFKKTIKGTTLTVETPFTYDSPDCPQEIHRLSNPSNIKHVFRLKLSLKRLLRIRRKRGKKWVLLKGGKGSELLNRFTIKSLPRPELVGKFGFPPV